MAVDMESLRANIADWLEQMAEVLEPGRFRFCSRGSLVPTQGQQAQFATCFAMKIAWQIGIWESWPTERKRGCIAFVKSFQNPDGWFIDQWLFRQAKPGLKERAGAYLQRILGGNPPQEKDARDLINIRAETRQSASTLLMVGDMPTYQLPLECSSTEEVERFIFSFDWSRPWAAGSHLSHLLFMLSVNEKFFDKTFVNAPLIDAAMACLAKLRDPGSGCWCQGNPDPVERINGAMKVFSGLQWLDRPYPDCRRLLDYSLDRPFQDDGCGFLNRLLVVFHARQGVPQGYHEEVIQKIARRALDRI